MKFKAAVLAFLFLALSPIGFGAAPARAEEEPVCAASCTILFAQLIMPAAHYSRALVPLFDDQPTFDALTRHLDAQRIFYSLADICMPMADFPKSVQAVLEGYGPGGTIIGRRSGSVLILKIQRRLQTPMACAAQMGARPSRETRAKLPPRGTNAAAGER